MSKTESKTALQSLKQVEFAISISARPEHSWTGSRSAGASVTVPLSGVPKSDIGDAVVRLLGPVTASVVMALTGQLEEMATAHLDAEREKRLAKEAAEAAKEE